MKKIGFVIPSFPVLSETFVGVQIRSVEAIGHPIELYAFDGHQKYQPLDEPLYQSCQYLTPTDPFTLKQMLLGMPKCHQFLRQQSCFSYLGLLKQGMQLAHRVSKDGCQHLHAHFAWHSAATAIIAAKALNISVSFVTHGDDIYLSPQDLNAKLQYANFICAVTRKMQSELRPLTTSPVHYLPCGIELERYKSELSNWPAKPKRFLFIGRLVEKKGIDILLKALSQCKNTPPIDIVGEGPLKETLLKQAKEHHLPNVNFLGLKNAQWLNDHADNYQGLIAPFKIAQNGSQDAAPLVIKEAMILGIPIITTDLAGCNEMLPQGTATQVKMGDIDTLQHAIEKHQLRSLNSINAQRQKAFSHARTQFCAKRLARNLSDLIEQIQ